VATRSGEEVPAGASDSSLARAAYRIGRILGRALAFVERLPPWLVLGSLVVVGWAITAEAGRIAPHDGPLYYHGGDGTYYYSTAWMLAHGVIPLSSIGYGYPLLLAPIAGIAGPNLLAGMPAVIALNQLLLAPAALLGIYGIVRMLAGRAYAYLATLVWVLSPVLVIHYFLADYHARYVDMTLPSEVGLLPLGDYPSMVLLIVAAYFTLRVASSALWADALAAGFATGLAVAVKPANLLFLPAPFLALLVARRFRGLGILALAIVPSLIGTTVWKQRGIGDLPAFASSSDGRFALAALGITLVSSIHVNIHNYLPFNWSQLHHNLDGLREYTWSQRVIYFTAGGGLIGLVRRSTVAAVLAGTWLAAYVIGKGSNPVVDVVSGGFFTHMMAAFPAYFLLVVSVPFLIPFVGRRRGPALPPSRGGRFPVVAAGLLGFASIAGALAVAVIPTSNHPWVARAAGGILVPIDRFPITAAAAGRAVTVSWRQQPSHGARVTYAVLRAPDGPGGDCIPPAGSSGTCDYSSDVVGSTDSTGDSFTDRAPRGTWLYRIALSATPVGPQQPTDYILLSRPVRVSVP
jgi:hypothetical protein